MIKVKIKYKDGSKYQLVEAYTHKTTITGFDVVDGDYVRLTPEGDLHILSGFCWDGPSGPTLDTKSSLRGSLVHDALYGLFSEYPEMMQHRAYADDLLYSICREDGMGWLRAWTWKKGVNWFGSKSARTKETVLEAP